MYKEVRKILFGLTIIAFPPVYAAPEIVLQQGDIKVTVEDVERYIISNTPKAQREAILNKKGIFKEIVENIYLIRRIGTEAEKDKNLDWEQIKWVNELAYKRLVMTAFMKNLVKQQLDNFDWVMLAKETYLAEADQYQIPEKIRASHILITTEDRTKTEAHTLINEIKDKALAGEDFEVLVKAYSEDPSAASNNGDLGLFSQGQMAKPFEQAAFAMTRVGELSDIVESDFGYHLIQFHERVAAGKQTFEAVKQQIILQLQQSRANQIRQDIMMDFRSASDLKWDEAQLESLRNKHRTAGKLDNSELKPSAE